mmetsp:Transcript_20040/g.36187  ORF Transcript_20040/g.36187 Transcript_20040/m.36187 type:complete len:465 (-) Transcript_20040:27-1421(-)
MVQISLLLALVLQQLQGALAVKAAGHAEVGGQSWIVSANGVAKAGLDANVVADPTTEEENNPTVDEPARAEDLTRDTPTLEPLPTEEPVNLVGVCNEQCFVDPHPWVDKCKPSFAAVEGDQMEPTIPEGGCQGCQQCAGVNSRAYFDSTRGCFEDNFDLGTVTADYDVSITFTMTMAAMNEQRVIRTDRGTEEGNSLLQIQDGKLNFIVWGNTPEVQSFNHVFATGVAFPVKLLYSQDKKRVVLTVTESNGQPTSREYGNYTIAKPLKMQTGLIGCGLSMDEHESQIDKFSGVIADFNSNKVHSHESEDAPNVNWFQALPEETCTWVCKKNGHECTTDSEVEMAQATAKEDSLQAALGQRPVGEDSNSWQAFCSGVSQFLNEEEQVRRAEYLPVAVLSAQGKSIACVGGPRPSQIHPKCDIAPKKFNEGGTEVRICPCHTPATQEATVAHVQDNTLVSLVRRGE